MVSLVVREDQLGLSRLASGDQMEHDSKCTLVSTNVSSLHHPATTAARRAALSELAAIEDDCPGRRWNDPTMF